MVAIVGRSEQLAVIDGALAAAAAGRGGLVLVTGESGIGKTSLADAARQRSAALGLQVAHGYAVDDPGAPVLWPWRRVGTRIPELEEVLATVTAPDLDDDAVRFRVSEAVAEGLRRAAGASGLLILLEDLHWADSLSVALLRHVALDLATSPVLVVATARDDPSTPVGRTLPDLLRGSAAESLPLRGLSPDEVVQWLASDEATAAWCPLADELVTRTDGNPFYIRVLTSEAPPQSGSLDDLLAERSGMRGLLVAPLLRLADDARHTITSAALMSERISPTLLAAATDRTVPVVSDHIAAATRAGLLRHGATGLSFVHALVRDAVVAHTDPQERLGAEAAIAAAMAATGDELLLGAAAAHWDRAGTPEASLRCRDSARTAAAQAATARAHEEAVAFARMSLRHARRLGVEGADLAERLGRAGALRVAGQPRARRGRDVRRGRRRGRGLWAPGPHGAGSLGAARDRLRGDRAGRRPAVPTGAGPHPGGPAGRAVRADVSHGRGRRGRGCRRERRTPVGQRLGPRATVRLGAG
ncbi:AAA family ATPase [Terrabacter sp. C0L_2]|uniref:AAA family ATPase n=1 Tax=Terrabacter sp. C0L_2 TaxID=3108389 RepID=UPI002ED156FF|nr:AAA family ATPase [Terrabacter sp. C0L_2]